jgi:hypothetical protein
MKNLVETCSSCLCNLHKADVTVALMNVRFRDERTLELEATTSA